MTWLLLWKQKKTTDIVDISNQSSKEGIRIVLELKKDTDVENLTNMLYKKKPDWRIPLASICWQLQTEDRKLSV